MTRRHAAAVRAACGLALAGLGAGIGPFPAAVRAAGLSLAAGIAVSLAAGLAALRFRGRR